MAPKHKKVIQSQGMKILIGSFEICYAFFLVFAIYPMICRTCRDFDKFRALRAHKFRRIDQVSYLE